MATQPSVSRFLDLSYFKSDVQGGFVSFLVAVPLCLGIALASGAPLFAGIIAGIVGGLVVGALSKSALSISGPEAGLILVVVSALESLGSFGALQVALCVAGLMQIVLGIARAGIISNFIPAAVIKGMLAAIGIILIMKQLPHLLGYDADAAETLALFPKTGSTIMSLLDMAVHHIQPTGLGIAVLALAVLVLWEQSFVKQHPVLSKVPGALIVVVLGVVVNQLVLAFNPALALSGTHLVQLPVVSSAADFKDLFTFPDFSQLTNMKVYVAALSIALVASLEALLAIEATDALDPLKRKTPTNWELKAQGAGNLVSGMLGGLPVTSVIVRSTVSLNAGGRTKVAALLHGSFLLISVLLFPKLLNMVPWAALAAILLVTGYKLARVSVFKEQFKGGITEFVPFLVTILAILATDLLIGIGIGAAVGMFFILRESYRNAHFFEHQIVDGRDKIRISLGERVSFLNKASILTVLKDIPENATLEIDGTNSAFIDRDILSAIEHFRDTARQRNIQVVFLRKGEDYTQELAEQRRLSEPEAEFEAYYKLFNQDRNWVSQKLMNTRHPGAEPTADDTPKFLFIGCCDSRVPASEIIGTAPGEVFVHRNVANLVVSTDLNLMSVLEYAVDVLGVEHIVVCGHYGCGGVQVAMENPDGRLLSSWLGNVREVMQRYRTELAALETDEERYHRLVELNVIEQVYNLYQTSAVLQARQQRRPLHIHGWVYDSHGGRIQDLQVDTSRDFAEYETTLRYHLRPDGLTRLDGTLHQPPAIYSIFANNTGGPIIAIPPLRGDAPLGTP